MIYVQADNDYAGTKLDSGSKAELFNMVFFLSGFDPIFYLHHCNIDRILAFWEHVYPSTYWMGDGYYPTGGGGPVSFSRSKSMVSKYGHAVDVSQHRLMGLGLKQMTPTSLSRPNFSRSARPTENIGIRITPASWSNRHRPTNGSTNV